MLPTVVLHHVRAVDAHYDWMLSPPGERGDLRTWRVPRPPPDWLALGGFGAVALPDHRRAYLQKQGTLTGRRGWVTRVAEGSFQPLLWTPRQVQVQLRWARPSGLPAMRLTLDRLTSERWRAVVVAAAPDS